MSDKTLISKNQVLHMVRKMARQLDTDYHGKGAVHVLVVLDGAIPFATELMKHINFPVYIHYVSKDTFPKMSFDSKSVLIVDIAVNTGDTMRDILQQVSKRGEEYDVKIATLLKRKGAKCWINYMGGSIGTQDEIYGYGLHSGVGLDSNLTEIKIKS
jgi:hypoxanthine-guanine phosphoribosyltransferase